MSFNSSILRRLLSIATILFNIALVAITLNNLANNLVLGSYVDVNYLLTVTSFMSIIIISIIIFLDVKRKHWMPYQISFELCWVVLILLFQFITAIVVSADQQSELCRLSAYSDYQIYNPCPAHSAALVFSWVAVIFLAVHTTLIVLEILRIAASAEISFLQVLQTQTQDLPACVFSYDSPDPEKQGPTRLTLTTSGSTGGSQSTGPNRPKHRPPPLDLSKLTTLPIYEAHAKEVAAAKAKAHALPKLPTKVHTRARTETNVPAASSTAAPPNRHQLMLQSMREASNATNLRQQLQPPPRSASSSFVSPWSPPPEWARQANDSVASVSTGSHYPHSRMINGQSVDSLPATNGHGLPSYHAEEQKSLPPVPRQSVMDRPDPRNRRAIQPDEVGGFWRVRGDRESVE